MACDHLPRYQGSLGQPSIAPTVLRSPVSGEPQNKVMSAQTEVTLDFRLVPDQTPEDLEAAVRALAGRITVDENGRVQFEVEAVESRPPPFISRDAEIVQVPHQVYQDTANKQLVNGGVPGSTDGTILADQTGVPIVICRLGDIHVPHRVDEWLSINESIEATRPYAVAAIRLLGMDREKSRLSEQQGYYSGIPGNQEALGRDWEMRGFLFGFVSANSPILANLARLGQQPELAQNQLSD